MGNVKIATWNIQSGVNSKNKFTNYTNRWKYILPHSHKPLSEIGHALEKENIGVAMLTEVDGGSFRSSWKDQSKAIAKSSGLSNALFFPTYNNSLLNQGNAIISKYPIKYIANHQLPGKGEPRTIGEAKIQLPNKDITLLVTHLSTNKIVREEQINFLSKMLKHKRGPYILAGDFNAESDEELKNVTNCNCTMCSSSPTYPSWNPKKSYDHIIASKDINLKKGYIPKLLYSDHLPLISEIETK